MPEAITPQQGFNDFWTWINAEIQSIETARALKGGGGWEQWALIQFLLWQTARRPTVSYQREFKVKGLRRAFDIAYNLPSNVPITPDKPLILTQWKAKNDGNEASREAQTDLGTLQEFKQHIYTHVETVAGMKVPILPILVILCPEQVNFQGVQPSEKIGNSDVRLWTSTDKTLSAYGLL
ncbi:hypothetical protein GCM10010191_46090 [Actinomadura vinacea]|uniref:Restriction endonuclease n=1 Tax=Actinomadura vinacea TaxID=115336 RepID=A0ABP5WI84_9ACTN